MIQLSQQQQDLKAGILQAWSNGARNVVGVLPTGGGKTVVFSNIVREANAPACVVAHRSELVSQASLSLARNDVRHRVIGPRSLQKACAALHMRELGRSRYDPLARVAVAGVDTLVRREKELAAWLRTVGLVVQDEGHHVLADNKWGTAAGMFPNARGLFVTANTVRADGKGLGRHADGLADALIIGPCGRDLIDDGYLTDYRIFAPQSDIDYSKVPVGASGELVMAKLRDVVHADKTIVGDVVRHYLKIAPGKLGITFCVDVAAATEQAEAYRKAGVPAEVVSANTPDDLRFNILRRFRNREILQLVNVDLFGEGFDLPTVSVVSMVRRTESFNLFCQQFGRALRVQIDQTAYAEWHTLTAEQRKARIAASEKPYAIIIDHVGNVARHGLPDVARAWTLDRRERRARSAPVDVIPVRACLNPECMRAYERYRAACPFCGHKPEPQARSAPEYVEGDLLELDGAVLAALREEAARLVGPVYAPAGLGDAAQGHLRKVHAERATAQRALRETMELWGGWQQHLGFNLSESFRRFWHRYGIDVATAQTLNAKDANELNERIRNELKENNIELAQ